MFNVECSFVFLPLNSQPSTINFLRIDSRFSRAHTCPMPAGFRLHSIPARQVDAVSRVRLKAFYAAEGKALVADFRAMPKGKPLFPQMLIL
jgi:hypothetical protein